MAGYAIMIAQCIGCGATITCNPHHVPSIRVNGSKEPLCKNCYERWNKIHRTSKGLKPIPLHPDAYGPIPEGEL